MKNGMKNRFFEIQGADMSSLRSLGLSRTKTDAFDYARNLGQSCIVIFLVERKKITSLIFMKIYSYGFLIKMGKL